MATIKSYTDLEQSKKLAEILPLESADMHYSKDFDGSWFVDLAEYASVKIPKYVDKVEEHLLPCWSLASLLGVLRGANISTPNPPNKMCIDSAKKATEAMKNGDLTEYNKYLQEMEDAADRYSCRNDYDITYASNPIDACYEMIIRLNELNLL